MVGAPLEGDWSAVYTLAARSRPSHDSQKNQIHLGRSLHTPDVQPRDPRGGAVLLAQLVRRGSKSVPDTSANTTKCSACGLCATGARRWPLVRSTHVRSAEEYLSYVLSMFVTRSIFGVVYPLLP